MHNKTPTDRYPLQEFDMYIVHPELWGDTPAKRQNALIQSAILDRDLFAQGYETSLRRPNESDFDKEVRHAVRDWIRIGVIDLVTERVIIAMRRAASKRVYAGHTVAEDAHRLDVWFWETFLPFIEERGQSVAPKAVRDAEAEKHEISLRHERGELTFAEMANELSVSQLRKFEALNLEYEELMELYRDSVKADRDLDHGIHEELKNANLTPETIREIELHLRDRFASKIHSEAWLIWLQRAYPTQYARYDAWRSDRREMLEAEDRLLDQSFCASPPEPS